LGANAGRLFGSTEDYLVSTSEYEQQVITLLLFDYDIWGKYLGVVLAERASIPCQF
jgi:hypothetical protein